MNEEDKKELLELIKEFNKEHKDKYRIVYIDEAWWKNIITLKKGVVKDLFFLGVCNSSNRPRCILEVRYKGKDYKIHTFINHVNFQSERELYSETLDGEEIVFKIQEFCNPITSHKIYIEPRIDKILKGQIMGQNSNSRYQRVQHVINDGWDYGIRNNVSKFLKQNATPLELLTKQAPYYLSAMTTEKIQQYPIPIKESEIAVKYKDNEYYSILQKDELENEKPNISEYYPIITYEQCVDILKNIPKQDIDFTVIGLGSAGTGILDQVSRSTYFNSYMLIDFDLIEEKNMRNQWYTRGKIGSLKTDASKSIINAIRPCNIFTKCDDFENVQLELYKTKYVVSGFDSLECRMNLLDKCLKDFESKYLIDIRYLDYSSSIYFIDLEDEKQVKYYRNLLQADIDGFKQQEENKKFIETVEDMKLFLRENNVGGGQCGNVQHKVFGTPWEIKNCLDVYCDGQQCADLWLEKIKNKNIKIEVKKIEESSCVRENFIDIYKYSSAFVFAAIREIESGNEKPFTHIEAQTDVIPSSFVARK